MKQDIFDNKDLQQSYKKIKDFINAMPVANDETIIPLTYLLTALYPNALKNLQDFMKKQYTMGYAQALEDIKNEKENKNETFENDRRVCM